MKELELIAYCLSLMSEEELLQQEVWLYIGQLIT